VLFGLLGAVGISYFYARSMMLINTANRKSVQYEQQLEDLNKKLSLKKIPKNLRTKVMEYFYYASKKNSLMKMRDFSNLSLPLQKEIALYQNYEILKKIPLFKDLDRTEILNVISKLKTSIYMPGDRIVREGEKSKEMFIIHEGVVEINTKILVPQRNHNERSHYDMIRLKKGDYFGQEALMVHSKRTFNAIAIEFCLLSSFSKGDYEELESEFPGIGPRLKSGWRHYKNTKMGHLVEMLGKLDFFENFTEPELQKIGDEYLEELYVNPNKVILAPRKRSNALYIVLGGKVSCYENNEAMRVYVQDLKRMKNNNEDWTLIGGDTKEIDCLDNQILIFEKDKISLEKQRDKLRHVKDFFSGESFGSLDFDGNDVNCPYFYLSESGCRIGAITQILKFQMANDDPILYEKLKKNFMKTIPDYSLSNRKESLIELPLNHIRDNNSRRSSNISNPERASFGGSPGGLYNKANELYEVKEGFMRLEEDLKVFENLVSNTYTELSKIFSQLEIRSKVEEQSPSNNERSNLKENKKGEDE